MDSVEGLRKGHSMAKKSKNAKKAKKAATKRPSKAKRAGGKRDLVKAKNATSYAKRSTRGRFSELDEVGRSQKADRRTKAKTKAKSGFGDRGDR
jgi:hypothetical protein